jgi:hypothetical protein
MIYTIRKIFILDELFCKISGINELSKISPFLELGRTGPDTRPRSYAPYFQYIVRVKRKRENEGRFRAIGI